MCTLCGLHTTTFSAGLPIGCFAVDAGRVGMPSTTFIAGVCCLDCNCILYLAGAYLIDDGNVEIA